MAEQFGDARLEEFNLLSEIERLGEETVTPAKGPRRDLVVYLIHGRLANYLHLEWLKDSVEQLGATLPYESNMERAIHQEWLQSLFKVLSNRELSLRLTHAGRVRRSELKQQLMAGKVREQHGILWDGRYLEIDLRIAIIEASEKSPLTVAYSDMNGLKTINDTFGHAAGDEALRAYFQSLAIAIGLQGGAYRVGGGDEVVTVLPSHDVDKATATLARACKLLEAEQLKSPASLAVGIVTTTNPRDSFDEIKRQADSEMYRAKEESHKFRPSPSIIAIRGKPELIRA